MAYAVSVARAMPTKGLASALGVFMLCVSVGNGAQDDDTHNGGCYAY